MWKRRNNHCELQLHVFHPGACISIHSFTLAPVTDRGKSALPESGKMIMLLSPNDSFPRNGYLYTSFLFEITPYHQMFVILGIRLPTIQLRKHYEQNGDKRTRNTGCRRNIAILHSAVDIYHSSGEQHDQKEWRVHNGEMGRSGKRHSEKSRTTWEKDTRIIRNTPRRNGPSWSWQWFIRPIHKLV